MDNYRELMNRMLQLVLQGNRSPAVAAMLEQEGYRSPRHNKPISATMIGKLLRDDPASHRQLTDPHLSEHQWLISDLATAVGVTQKKLKDWVHNGWIDRRIASCACHGPSSSWPAARSSHFRAKTAATQS